MQQQTVDIEQIIQDIKLEIETKGLRNTVLPFNEVHATSFVEIVLEMERFKRIYAYRALKSRRGLPGKAILFFKKVIRKMSKFYIEPIVDDQNVFNYSVVQGMQYLCDYLGRPDQQMAIWRAVRELRVENVALRQKVEQLEEKLQKAGN
jgi:hypothetical protein